MKVSQNLPVIPKIFSRKICTKNQLKKLLPPLIPAQTLHGSQHSSGHILGRRHRHLAKLQPLRGRAHHLAAPQGANQRGERRPHGLLLLLHLPRRPHQQRPDPHSRSQSKRQRWVIW